MLIRAGGMRIADDDRLLRHRCANTVRNDPVIRKVSSADHVSGTAGRDRTVSVRKEGLFIAVCHKLGARFAVGIRIIAVQAVHLAVAVLPLPVLVDLIRRHV